MQTCGVRSLIAIGSADHHYDRALLDELHEAMNAELVVVAGADHGFDIPGDVTGSIEALGQAIKALDQFIDPVHHG